MSGEREVEQVTICAGCGATWSDEDLAVKRASNPGLLSCCPERKMVAYVPKSELAAATLCATTAERAGFEKGVRATKTAVLAAIEAELAIASRSCGTYARPYRDMQKAVRKIALIAPSAEEERA